MAMGFLQACGKESPAGALLNLLSDFSDIINKAHTQFTGNGFPEQERGKRYGGVTGGG